MSSPVELKCDWATPASARYAVEHWHYSKRLPVFKMVRIGAWENGTFIGVVLFGQGATPEFGKRFDLAQTEVCELTRVALNKHANQTTRIIRVAISMLRRRCPGLRLIISFADTAQGHHGGIYQGGNWIYAGESVTHGYLVHGVIEHPKTLHSRYGTGGQSIPWLREHIDPNASRVVAAVKHRYLMPLDEEMRRRVLKLAKPYPKKRAGSIDVDASGHQPEEGGSTPTPALNIEAVRADV